MRTGYFDHDGKCLLVQTGEIAPPIDFAYSAEVPDTLGPSTVEYDKAQGKIKVKVREQHPPRPPKPNLRMKIEELEARIAVLEGLVNP